MWHVSLKGAWTKPFEVPLGHGCPNASIAQAIEMAPLKLNRAHTDGARPRSAGHRAGHGPKHDSASMANALWNHADITRNSGCRTIRGEPWCNAVRRPCGRPTRLRREVMDEQTAAIAAAAGSDDQRKHHADRHDGDDGGDQGLGQGVDHALQEFAARADFGNGSPGRARTADPVINSHLLYRLSYRGIGRARSLGVGHRDGQAATCTARF